MRAECVGLTFNLVANQLAPPALHHLLLLLCPCLCSSHFSSCFSLPLFSPDRHKNHILEVLGPLRAQLLGSGSLGRLWTLRACLTSSFTPFGLDFAKKSKKLRPFLPFGSFWTDIFNNKNLIIFQIFFRNLNENLIFKKRARIYLFQLCVSRRELDNFSSNITLRDDNKKLKIISQGQARNNALLLISLISIA